MKIRNIVTALCLSNLLTTTAILAIWLNPNGLPSVFKQEKHQELKISYKFSPVSKTQEMILEDAFGVLENLSDSQKDYLLTHRIITDFAEDSKQIQCLARNAYFEARGESETGKLFVMLTTLNRAKKRGLTPCSVVYEKNKNTCEFSWTCDGFPDTIRNYFAYRDSVKMAEKVLAGEFFDRSFGAEYYWNPDKAKSFFHQSLIMKGWCRKRIDNHIFLRKPIKGENCDVF